MSLPLFFFGCNGDNDNATGPVSVAEDGFYVVGEATSIPSLSAEDAEKALMAPGANENDDQKPRDGMYEKYVALEGGKSFSVVIKEAAKETKYGGSLSISDTLRGDNEPAIRVYKGALVENDVMQVQESGLYHIVLDLNKDGSLSDKLIVIAPVAWGVRGAMNGWGFTPLTAPAFNKTTMTYTLTDVTVETAGAFKFAYGSGWKIELNAGATPLVKANTNLGADDAMGLKPGGGDISIARAKYTIDLTWTLGKGAVGNSFKYTVTETGKLEALDPTAFVYSLIGDAIYNDTTQSSWDYDADFTYVGKSENTYTYEISNIKLGVGAFKVRFGHDWSKNFGLATKTDNVLSLISNGGNITQEAEATYAKIIFSFDWVNDAETNPTLTLQP